MTTPDTALPSTRAKWDARTWELNDEGEAEGGAAGFGGRRQQAYQDAFRAAMTGGGDFFEPDDEQRFVPQLKALRDACALVGVTPAERWAYLEGCLSALAHEHAFLVASRP